MTQPSPKIRKDEKESTPKGKGPDPNHAVVPWGRGASVYRPGLSTKQYFLEHGEACAADIYYALSQEIQRLNRARLEIGEKPFRRPNYSSFSRYVHWFAILGLIERTDRREPAVYSFLQRRVIYRLTMKGKTEVKAWKDPIAIRHPEFRTTRPDTGTQV
jgi:hypothetical protein